MRKLKLSEAIRLGAMWRPQAFGVLTDGVGTCAIGAATEAMGLPLDDEMPNPREWDFVLKIRACPVCITHDPDRLNVVAHLNDDHRWTRERIADWVETIEAQHEQPVAEQPVTVTA